eukprot:TCALIF_03276-PA protein Name:"Protein of unknown function" AED:0.67 eAED:0.77 QI:0/0/0/0.33/1/1/3/0/315
MWAMLKRSRLEFGVVVEHKISLAVGQAVLEDSLPSEKNFNYDMAMANSKSSWDGLLCSFEVSRLFFTGIKTFVIPYLIWPLILISWSPVTSEANKGRRVSTPGASYYNGNIPNKFESQRIEPRIGEASEEISLKPTTITYSDPEADHALPQSHHAESRDQRWRAMYAENWHERVRVAEVNSPLSPFPPNDSFERYPRRVGGSGRNKDVELFRPQDALEVLPREIESEELPSTPHLNAIMDNAMGKVKAMLLELENEKGKRHDVNRVTGSRDQWPSTHFFTDNHFWVDDESVLSKYFWLDLELLFAQPFVNTQVNS